MLFHVLFVALVLTGLAAACWWVYQRSPQLGAVVCAGAALRVAGGGGLFAISYLNLDFLSQIHTGDGFWDLAPDGRVYYNLALRVASGGLGAVSSADPSPFYVATLGLWLQAAGPYVLSAVLFNLVCFVAACLAIAVGLRPWEPDPALPGRTVRRDAALVALASLSFSPVLLLLGTQVLKDSFFALLIVLISVGAIKLIEALSGWRSRPGWAVGAWLLVVLVAQYGIAATRAYYSVFVWAAFAGALAVLLARRRRLAVAAASGALLCALWLAFVIGAGSYYVYYAGLVSKATGVQVPTMAFGGWSETVRGGISEPDVSGVAGSFVALRRGFVYTGGATSLAEKEDAAAMASAGRVLRDLSLGLAAMFVPISILQELSLVSIAGGRGFLVVTDLDTLFIDLSLVGIGLFLFRQRACLGRRAPQVLFAALMVFLCAILLAYVVTNFGTLFRLRLLAVVPAWLAPLVAASREQD